MIMLAVLYHNLDKITTSQINYKGIIYNGHDVEGEKLCISFLKQITRNNTILETISKLVHILSYACLSILC